MRPKKGGEKMGDRIGELVKQLRGPMTQKHFGKLLNIPQSTLCNIEKGKREPSKAVARKLAAYSGLPISKFLGGDE
jgi:transcriptional regulator with XRE-family HTH domain